MNYDREGAGEVARQWMLQEGGRAPGFSGAYIAGSTNWLPDDADLIPASDLDVIVVTSDRSQAGWPDWSWNSSSTLIHLLTFQPPAPTPAWSIRCSSPTTFGSSMSSINKEVALHDQLMACLFAAG